MPEKEQLDQETILDVDSDLPAAFDDCDRRHLEDVCALIASRIGG